MSPPRALPAGRLDAELRSMDSSAALTVFRVVDGKSASLGRFFDEE
jgi:hypothetical protein